MIAEQWEHIKDVFEAALERSPEERQSLIADLKRDYPAIADEVEQLLHSYEAAGDFLVSPCSLNSDFLDDLEAEQHRFAPGDLLCERFRIVHLIGYGGMGEVYKAWDEELEDHVALKTLRLEISKHELFTSRFRREIQLARKVTHPNVCRIFDGFKHAVGDGTYVSVLSMELLQGQTLSEHLKAKGRLSVAEALPILRQIISGLSAIHAAGVVHRDLKPANLVLVPEGRGRSGVSEVANHSDAVSSAIQGLPDADGRTGAAAQQNHSDGGKAEQVTFRLKITDFGIAGRLPDSLSPVAQAEVSKVLGTPDYMAPEQLEHGRTSVRSDIYSLGLVLYEMMTGIRPFAATSAWKRISSDPPPAGKIATDLPESWNRAITCCLERQPEYRFKSAQDVEESLKESTASAAKIPVKPWWVRLQRATNTRAGLATVFFLLLTALVAGAFRYFNQSPEIPAGTTVLLTNVQNKTNDPHFLGITLALKAQLRQSAHFEVELEEDGKPVKPPDHMKAEPLVVSGTLSRNPLEGFTLSIALERVESIPFFPARRWQQDFKASDDRDLFNAVQRAATWIRTKAGEAEARLREQNRPLSEITSNSWPALRLLNQGNAMVAQSDYPSAENLLRSAIREDPDFLAAHMRLADILISMRRDHDGFVEWENTIATIRAQERNKPRLTDRENLRIKGQYYEDTGDYGAAEAAFRELTRLYPTDYLGWFYLGSTLDKGGRKEEALEPFLQAVKLRPDSSAAHSHLAMLYITLKNYTDADREIKAVADAGAAEWATWLKAILAFVQNNVDGALANASVLAASSKPDFASSGYSMQASLLADVGRPHEAITALEQGISSAEHSHQADQARQADHADKAEKADKLISLAYLHYRQKEFAECKRIALQAVDLDPSPRHRLEAGSLLALTGDVPSAKIQLKALTEEPAIPLVNAAISKLNEEIRLASRDSRFTELYFMQAMQTGIPSDAGEYPRNVVSSFGDAVQTAKIFKPILDSRGHNLMYRDHDFPGLWTDSLGQLLQLHNPQVACGYAKKYLELRPHSAPNYPTPNPANQLNALACVPDI